MRIKMLVVGFAVIVLMLSFGAVYAASDNPGTSPGGWYCPWKWQGRMMHNGSGCGCSMGGQRGAYQQNQGQPVTKDQAAWFSQGVRCPRATWR